MIRMTPIRVIGADGEQVGIIETPVALRMAETAGLDLVEISPDARPPVCKIMDYGKFKYETSKNESKNKSKASELKEIRLGRSVKIDPHDVGIRINQARRFLLDGHKVQVTQRFKGREMAHRELGIAHLRQFRDELADIAKCESEPRFMGPQASIILAPEKAKCEAYKQKHQKVLNKAKAAEARQEAKEKAAKESKLGPDGKPLDAAALAALAAAAALAGTQAGAAANTDGLAVGNAAAHDDLHDEAHDDMDDNAADDLDDEDAVDDLGEDDDEGDDEESESDDASESAVDGSSADGRDEHDKR